MAQNLVTFSEMVFQPVNLDCPIQLLSKNNGSKNINAEAAQPVRFFFDSPAFWRHFATVTQDYTENSFQNHNFSLK